MATKADIAKLAGVSPATVSNCYTGNKTISPDVNQRIIEAAKALGYPLPNQLRGSRTESMHIFFIVDDVYNPHYGDIITGMNSVAVPAGICVSMMEIWNDIPAFCKMLVKQQASAVYFATYHHNIPKEQIAFLNANGIETFFEWDSFFIDFQQLMTKAITYLKELGHTKIAYMSGLSLGDPNNLRYKIFAQVSEELGLLRENIMIIDGIFPYKTDAKSGYWCMKNFLKTDPDFTALITINDLMAIGAINAMAESSLSVPDDVSVIGCDDIILSEFLSPSLTTLNFSAKDIGVRTMYAILQRRRDCVLEPIELHTNMIIRKSTGKAPR
ncbi:MAG: LacI family DNA-binding transcriptional regulator [Clostridia bacterium]|nr:LacI family DNA-binding transcriptional regulator [Clostridia bacterium]